MPELPEVEHLVSGVRAVAVGCRFARIDFYRDDVREPMDKAELRKALLSQTVTAVTRRGKYMLVHTTRGALGIHLGMSGRFVFDESAKVSRPHTHVVFALNQKDEANSFSFHFVDPRRFGRVFALTTEEATAFSHSFLRDLGVEPLDQEVDLGKHLFVESRSRKVPVKNFIMDGHVVVGVGNIYASESLWRAKISPLVPANELSRPALTRLATEIKKTLSEAIAAGGTTFRDYRNSHDKPGMFQVKLAVYERDGEPCRRCGKGLIEKITQGGRSTYLCPVCQK